jgi:excinuclease UvrABC helicase subunit UvrB
MILSVTNFSIDSKYAPTPDQKRAIDALATGVEKGINHQVLLGVTGSGKTFTAANVIEKTAATDLNNLSQQNLSRHSYTRNSVTSFPKTRFLILSPIMTIISLKHTFQAQIRILKKTPE